MYTTVMEVIPPTADWPLPSAVARAWAQLIAGVTGNRAPLDRYASCRMAGRLDRRHGSPCRADLAATPEDRHAYLAGWSS
jgi:hypothetical protein